METAWTSTNGCVNNEDMYLYIHTRKYNPAIFQNEILPLETTRMDLECEHMLSEINQPEKYEYTYMQNLTIETNKQNTTKANSI